MGHTIFNEINQTDFDLKKIKLQVLITDNLEKKINKRISELSLENGTKPKPVSAYVRNLIEADCNNIKNK